MGLTVRVRGGTAQESEEGGEVGSGAGRDDQICHLQESRGYCRVQSLRSAQQRRYPCRLKVSKEYARSRHRR
jgi:hypothetical protein